MTTAAILPEPDALFEASAPAETALRRQYLRIGASASHNRVAAYGPFERGTSAAGATLTTEVSREWVTDVVKRSASVLETVLVAACLVEELDALGASSFEASGQPAAYFQRRVIERGGVDPFELVAEARALGTFDDAAALPHGTPTPPLTPTAVLRSARAVLEECPIDELEFIAARCGGLEVWAHRCRVAYEGLRAFALRVDPDQPGRLAVVGRVYAAGEVSIEEAALMLDVDPPDAVAMLEAQGYARSIEKVRLDPEARAKSYAMMRADRIQRQGDASPFLGRVGRDVIASERIEGVDARSWISRQSR